MSGRRREEIKNILLVVLFLTTILFLYLLWTHDTEKSFSLLDVLSGHGGEVDVPSVEEVAVPRLVAISDGSGVFRMASGSTAGLSAAASELIKEACAETTVTVNEINEQQYSAVMSRYSSVQIALSRDVPFTDFVRYHLIRIGTQQDLIRNISMFAFSDASRESIFIYDAPQDRYFRLRTGEPHEFSSQIRSMSTLDSDSYYLSSDILGAGNAFLPVSVQSQLSELTYVTDAAVGGRDLRNSMAEVVMGENFDFVRRIIDGFGNITYMYGYGQKNFTAFADGSFEYRGEVSNGNSGDFYEDLKTAISFVARCGGWPGAEAGEPSLVLDRSESFSEGRRSGHRYYFSQLVYGVPIRGEDGYAAEIEITNGQVSYFRRCTLTVGRMQSSGRSETVEAANVIANNCNHIYNVLNNNTLVAATDEAFSYVSAVISEMRQGYFKSSGIGELKPCWIVRTQDGTEFYFDLYDALPLGFSRSEQDGLE